MSGDPNRDAAIRYTDEQARQEQIAERAHEIAERMAADRLDTARGCQDLVFECDPCIGEDLQAIIEYAESAMIRWAALDQAQDTDNYAITRILRTCVSLAKTMHDCAMDAVQDDADEEAEREFGEDA